MSVRPRKCQNCGAPIPLSMNQCSYCGIFLDAPAPEAPRRSSCATRQAGLFPRLPAGAGEFGLRGKRPFIISWLVAASIYGAGWLVEDTRYWLADEAIALWAVALPIELLLAATFWRPTWGGWLAGFIFAISIFIAHVTIMWSVRGRLNDDYLGIAAMFAGAAFAGWITGRILHFSIRRMRARAELQSKPSINQ